VQPAKVSSFSLKSSPNEREAGLPMNLRSYKKEYFVAKYRKSKIKKQTKCKISKSEKT